MATQLDEKAREVQSRIWAAWDEQMLDNLLGRGYVEGLSFKVRLDSRNVARVFGSKRRVYDRPFTRRQAKAERWRLWRLRWSRRFWGPIREARRRLSGVWRAVRGRECGGCEEW